MNSRRLSRPPDEEILHQAGRLFARQGFHATSTREIAEAAGLRQGSLFHHFPSKEAILVALSERALIRPLEVLDEITSSPAPPAVQLFQVVHFQVAHLCGGPVDLAAVLQPTPRLARSRYRRFLADVERYTDGIRSLVAAGVAAGDFTPVDPTMATMAILGMANWTLRWFHAGGPRTGDEIADEFARFALRSLLADPATLESVANASRAR